MDTFYRVWLVAEFRYLDGCFGTRDLAAKAACDAAGKSRNMIRHGRDLDGVYEIHAFSRVKKPLVSGVSR